MSLYLVKFVSWEKEREKERQKERKREKETVYVVLRLISLRYKFSPMLDSENIRFDALPSELVSLTQ